MNPGVLHRSDNKGQRKLPFLLKPRFPGVGLVQAADSLLELRAFLIRTPIVANRVPALIAGH